MYNSKFEKHRLRVLQQLELLSKGRVEIQTNVLKMHQYFRAVNKKRIIVIVPYPEHSNYCLNVADREKVEEQIPKNEHDSLYILFGKLTPTGLQLVHCIAWKRFNFGEMPIKEGKLGSYYFITESILEDLKNFSSMPLFEGLPEIANELDGLFS